MAMGSKSREIDRVIERARQDKRVLAVILFGSMSTGAQGPLSDVDLCLVLDPRFVGDEKSVFEKRLDYLGEFDLDVQIFQQLPLYIRRRVLKEGRALFVRDEDLLYELAYRTAQAFEDFKQTYGLYLEQIARAGS